MNDKIIKRPKDIDWQAGIIQGTKMKYHIGFMTVRDIKGDIPPDLMRVISWVTSKRLSPAVSVIPCWAWSLNSISGMW